MSSCLSLVHEEELPALCLGTGPISWAQRGRRVLGSLPCTFNSWQKEPACRQEPWAVPGSALPDSVASGCPSPPGLHLIWTMVNNALEGPVGMCRAAQ